MEAARSFYHDVRSMKTEDFIHTGNAIANIFRKEGEVQQVDEAAVWKTATIAFRVLTILAVVALACVAWQALAVASCVVLIGCVAWDMWCLSSGYSKGYNEVAQEILGQQVHGYVLDENELKNAREAGMKRFFDIARNGTTLTSIGFGIYDLVKPEEQVAGQA